jgi:hypothetical protein
MSAWEYEVTELSEGFAATVYDDNGRMVADHLSEEHARDGFALATLIDIFPDYAWEMSKVRASIEQEEGN